MEIAVLTTMLGAALAVSGNVCAISDSFVKRDGRTNRKPPSRLFFFDRASSLKMMRGFMMDGSEINQFRSNKSSFDQICNLIEVHWEILHPTIGPNASFFIRDRVASKLYHLMHKESIVGAAKTFGISMFFSLLKQRFYHLYSPVNISSALGFHRWSTFLESWGEAR